jgi:hypothetical protein
LNNTHSETVLPSKSTTYSTRSSFGTALSRYADDTPLTLNGVLLAGVNHIENFNGQHCMTVNQDVIGMAHPFMGTSNAAASILSRKNAQIVCILYQSINQLLRRNRIRLSDEFGYGL